MPTTKIKHQPKHHRSFFLPLIIVVIVLAGVGGYLSYHHYHIKDTARTVSQTSSVRHENSISYAPSQPSDNAANDERKGSSTSSGSTSGTTLNTPTTTPSFSATVSYARKDTTTQSIDAAANVNGVTSGTCVFNFSHSTNGTVVLSSPSEQVEETNQSAACPPVIVAMPGSGNWYVSVVVTNDGEAATGQWAANPVVL